MLRCPNSCLNWTKNNTMCLRRRRRRGVYLGVGLLLLMKTSWGGREVFILLRVYFQNPGGMRQCERVWKCHRWLCYPFSSHTFVSTICCFSSPVCSLTFSFLHNGTSFPSQASLQNTESLLLFLFALRFREWCSRSLCCRQNCRQLQFPSSPSSPEEPWDPSKMQGWEIQ